MKKIMLKDSSMQLPLIGLGCMRIPALKTKEAVRNLVDAAMDEGITFFDHADIYGGGEAESLFGAAVKGISRGSMIIQTKCGIRPGVCYDFSRDYILQSVEDSLKRLDMDHIDILLLHRPDALMEPEEVAEAFDRLEAQGKVRYFGVSNQNPFQIELLNRYCKNRIILNQLQFSIAHCTAVDSGLNVNISNEAGVMRDGGILDYCRLNGIRIQAWSPFQYGMFQGTFLGNEKFPQLNRYITELAEKYQVTDSAIAAAWIMRHPAGIQTIAGSTSTQRIQDIAKACTIELTRQEWYGLYMAAGKQLP